MDSLFSLQTGTLIRVATGLFLMMAAWVLYRRKAEASVAALAMAFHQFGLVLANVPLLFSLNISDAYILFHGVLMLLVSHLRGVAVAFLPLTWSSRGLDSLLARRKWWLTGVTASFVFFSLLVMVLKSLPYSDTTRKLEQMLFIVDGIINLFSLTVLVWYLWRVMHARLGNNLVTQFSAGVFGVCLVAVYVFSGVIWVNYQELPTPFVMMVSFLVLIVFSGLYLIAFSLVLSESSDKSDVLPSGWVGASSEIAAVEKLELVWTPLRFVFILDVWMENGERKQLQVERDRLTKPGAHWLAFALATKHGIDLQHGDMNVVKFRMVDWWNKGSAHALQQRSLFQGSRGSYRLTVPKDRIKIHVDEDLLDFDVVKEAMLDFSLSWVQTEALRSINLKKPDLNAQRSQWIALLLREA